MMFQDVTETFSPDDIRENTTVAALANIPIFFWLPLVKANRSPFARYSANHGLWLLLLSVVGGAVLSWVPIFHDLLSDLWGMAITVLWIFLLIFTLRGQAKEVPIISTTKLIK